MNQQTVDIFKNIVSQLGVDLIVTSVVANVDGTFTLTSSCTWWLSLNMFVTIGGNPYQITAFDINVSITVKSVGPTIIPVPGTSPLNAPQFIHGTLKMANNDVDAQPDRTVLCPFVYLFEIIRDKKNTDEESTIDRETEVRLFFLNSVDSSNWLTADHYTNFVYPMQQMVDLFISKIKDSALFTFNLDYDTTALINVSEQGNQEKSIFDCNLSGIELRLFAEIRENLSCTNQCDCL
jgi:hypothetical protein